MHVLQHLASSNSHYIL